MAQKRSVFFFFFGTVFVLKYACSKTYVSVYHSNNYFIYETRLHVVIKTNVCIPLHGVLLMLWMKFEANQLLQKVTKSESHAFFKSLKMYHFHLPRVCNFDQLPLEEK